MTKRTVEDDVSGKGYGVSTRIGDFAVLATGDEFLFGFRWTRASFLICVGPFMLGWFAN